MIFNEKLLIFIRQFMASSRQLIACLAMGCLIFLMLNLISLREVTKSGFWFFLCKVNMLDVIFLPGKLHFNALFF